MRPAEVHLLRAKLLTRRPVFSYGPLRDEVEEALHHEPQYAEAVFWNARLSSLRGRRAEAERRIRDAMHLNPSEPRYALALFAMSLPYVHGVEVPDAFDWRRAEELEPIVARMARHRKR